jgi:hypothetical protein
MAAAQNAAIQSFRLGAKVMANLNPVVAMLGQKLNFQNLLCYFLVGI